ncbi:MAG: type II secretion system F family protein [Chloroflexi bacterium]|nr:type II secretion system F family protein [Chloroflexota bacterium]
MTGKRVRGRLDAESVDAAYETLRREALVPYKLAPVRERRTSYVNLAPALFKPTTQNLVDFPTQLSALLGSGVPLRRALETLKNESPSPGLKYALATVIRDIEGGQRFSEAMEKHTTVFSASYMRLIKVGEATGGLPLSLQRIGAGLRQQKGVQDKVRGALSYPIISLLMALVAGGILIVYSLPQLIELLDEFDSNLPLATRMLKNLTEFLNQWFTTIAIAAASIAALGWVYGKTERGAYLRDRLLLRAPVLGGVILRSNMFSLTSDLPPDFVPLAILVRRNC